MRTKLQIMWPILVGRARALGAATAIIMAAACPAAAQSYPSRPITIVLPFAAGGGGDILARIIAAKLEARLGKPIIVDAKPGAAGVIGTNIVAKSAADGATLLMATSTPLAINVTLHKSLPYDPAADFIPVANIAAVPFVLVVNPALPIRTVPELIAYAKANPGKLSFGSSGAGTPQHLFMEMFKSMTGTDMVHGPYKGTLPTLNDLIGGHIDLMFCDIGPCFGQLQAGKVRPLGIATRTRFPTTPDIAPISEVGVPGFEAAAWQMLVVPARTPRDIVEKLHAEVTAILELPDVRQQVTDAGFISMDNPSVDDLQAFVKSEIARWGKVVRDTGLAGSQ